MNLKKKICDSALINTIWKSAEAQHFTTHPHTHSVKYHPTLLLLILQTLKVVSTCSPHSWSRPSGSSCTEKKFDGKTNMFSFILLPFDFLTNILLTKAF